MPYKEDYVLPSSSSSSSTTSSSSSSSAAADAHDAQYFDSYADLSVHRVMLDDAPRMRFYRDVLCDRAVVRDAIVVDVGSGTGVLSCWAAKYGGAAHVFSIEASSLATLQPAMFAENGLRARYVRVRDEAACSSDDEDDDDDKRDTRAHGPAHRHATNHNDDNNNSNHNDDDDNNNSNHNDDDVGGEVRVTVLHGTVEALARGGAAAFVAQHDVLRRVGGVALLVSEWMGFYLLHENMLPSVLCARDWCRDMNAYLARDSCAAPLPLQMLPSSATLYVAPVTLRPFFAARYAAAWDDVGGVAMHTMATAAFDAAMAQASSTSHGGAVNSPLIDTLPAACLLHEGKACWHASLQTLRADACARVEQTVAFCFARSPIARRVWAEEEAAVAAAAATSSSSSLSSSSSSSAAAAAVTADARVDDDDGGKAEVLLSVDGFAVWFDVHYGDAHVLRTGPDAPATHWKQTTIVLPPQVRAARLVSFARPATLADNNNNNSDKGGGNDDHDDATTLQLTLRLTAQPNTAQRCYTMSCELN